jgi:predicted transcriptional regulator
MIQALTVRLPDDLYEELRAEAFKAHQPMNVIIIDALRTYLRVTAP